MARRSGVTLVEVLVAIFVMGIGMIALLTLFPIGILRMAQAINDERSAQAAYIAHENSIIYNIRNDPTVVAQLPADLYNKGQPNTDLFKNPYPFTVGRAAALPNADPYGESYTLFVDPIGMQSGATSPWVGGFAGLLRRRPVSFAIGPTAVSRAFTLWDDMTFNSDPTLGLPGTPELAGAFVMRNSRFSWGYTMRRPVTSEKSVVECSIVVFDSRSLSLNANLSLGEYVYNQAAYLNPNNNTVVVNYTGNTPPPIRPGNWIMDATQYHTKGPNRTLYGAQHNYWYRVLATQDVGTDYTVFEVQGVIRGFNNFSPGAAAPYPSKTWVTAAGAPVNMVVDPTGLTGEYTYPGTVVILDGVAEVFEKGPVRAP